MAHGEICPVCKGSGKYQEQKCHGCDGNGWIQVGVEYHPPWHVYPSYPTYPIDPHTWKVTCGDTYTDAIGGYAGDPIARSFGGNANCAGGISPVELAEWRAYFTVHHQKGNG